LQLFAIEAWRLAAQISISLDLQAQAVTCLREAIRVAEGTDSSSVKISSANEAARTLAALCERRGLSTQARSLYDQADAMERGDVGTQTKAVS
jgi:hypothetical protein